MVVVQYVTFEEKRASSTFRVIKNLRRLRFPSVRVGDPGESKDCDCNDRFSFGVGEILVGRGAL